MLKVMSLEGHPIKGQAAIPRFFFHFCLRTSVAFRFDDHGRHRLWRPDQRMDGGCWLMLVRNVMLWST
jgi:hypothetical protein